MQIEIRALRPEDRREDFECGEPLLDHFFRRYAGQNQFRHHIGTTYVAVDASGMILGYVTVSMATLTREAIGGRSLPGYPLPVLRVARLAVQRAFHGLGIGRRLLGAMARLAIDQRDRLGCVGMVVDAKPDAVSFYEKFGFGILEEVDGQVYRDTTPMFLPVQTLEEAMN